MMNKTVLLASANLELANSPFGCVAMLQAQFMLEPLTIEGSGATRPKKLFEFHNAFLWQFARFAERWKSYSEGC